MFTYPFLVQCEIIRRESEELCSDPSSASTKLGELRQVPESLCVSGSFTCQIYLSDRTYWMKSQALGQTPMCDFSGLTTRDYKSSACQSSRGKLTSPPTEWSYSQGLAPHRHRLAHICIPAQAPPSGGLFIREALTEPFLRRRCQDLLLEDGWRKPEDTFSLC